MREAFLALGLDPVDVPMTASLIRSHPDHSPFDWDVSAKRNVVATWGPSAAAAAHASAAHASAAHASAAHPAGSGHRRSLILNGHVDVVSPEPVDRWTTGPFDACRDGEWLIGRGSADMKAGLAAMIGAVSALQRLGLEPLAPVRLQSVVEEECTGNGTLACLLAGHRADAAIVLEPFGDAITTSQVGVLWFRVRVRGSAGHAGDIGPGSNPIESTFEIIAALRRLEAALNYLDPRPGRYAAYHHPINLNVGTIQGGDWPSTVPGECVSSYRIASFPGETLEALRRRIEHAVEEAAAADPFLRGNPPLVEYSGFAAEGYEIADDEPLVRGLAGAFWHATGREPSLIASTATSDAGVLGRFGVPAICFGPYGEAIHGADERVSIPSIIETAGTLALFIRDWCGLTHGGS
jgi:acetylornithine deacetylase